MDPEPSPPPEPALERLRRYAGILSDFTRLAPDATDADALFHLACTGAGRGTGIRHVKAMRHRPDQGDLLVVAGFGWRPGVVGHATLGTDIASPPGQALQTRQPVVVEDLPNEPTVRYSSLLRDHGIVSVLNVPVAVDGDLWGVLEVDSDVPRHFGADDVIFLAALGNALGLALSAQAGARRAEERGAEAARALADERTMLRELQHRAKNDLQLILSLLLMQRRRAKDPETARLLTHVMDRIAAVGMAHDQLAHPGSAAGAAGAVPVADYLAALCGNLAHRREGVAIETALQPVTMPHGRAVPLGLIVNELVTNALKHAFPGDREGTVRVAFRALTGEEGTGEGELIVSDDGVGMGPPRPGSSGTDLVGRLVRQTGGTMERMDQAAGTGFRVTFPLVT